jgi:hypothetical protein
LLLAPQAALAQDQAALAGLLGRPILGPRQAAQEWHDYLDPRIPRLPEFKTAAEWETYAGKLRQTVLDQVVFKGKASQWRTAKTAVEWLDPIAGGPGYRIRKLRYEALPGLWVPALLYEPEKLTGKVAVALAVNGHDRLGKAAVYKQVRCINMARRGMLVLNVEWFGMGQLSQNGFSHGAMNQLDLCGAAGLAPFYLGMSRALDLLLAHPSADPKRVSVSGLSGGGWQTIVISSLDPRVTLSNPVAGYSSFRTRLVHAKDLGDSEQTPCDLAVHADYTHLTAMMAPRPTLLTYNAKDDCCFEAGYALPPLLDSAGPLFTLHGKKNALRSHINYDPGTHNFEKDNRQALYRMLGDFFFADDKSYSAEEIPCASEVKSREDLAVELPEKNLDFQKLALGLASGLPRNEMPTERMKVQEWQKTQRERLKQIVKAHDLTAQARQVDTATAGDCKATFWQVQLGKAWTVPVVELVKGQPRETVVLLNDSGRKTDAATVERWLKAGQRVLAVDLALQGEGITDNRSWLLALVLSSEGERLVGLQASQLTAVARWARGGQDAPAVTLAATGPRTSTAALIAAALETEAIGKVELLGSLGSLKQIIEDNRTVNQWPEMFCFGLLESFDLLQIAALAAPHEVVFRDPGPRVQKELAPLKKCYELLGKAFDPLAGEKRP